MYKILRVLQGLINVQIYLSFHACVNPQNLCCFIDKLCITTTGAFNKKKKNPQTFSPVI